MLIFERELLTTMMSFSPSPSRSATRNWLICASMGKISGPVKPNEVSELVSSLCGGALVAMDGELQNAEFIANSEKAGRTQNRDRIITATKQGKVAFLSAYGELIVKENRLQGCLPCGRGLTPCAPEMRDRASVNGTLKMRT